MSFDHRTTRRFRKRFKALSENDQRRAEAQYRLLVRNPWHPSLHFKNVGTGKAGPVWSARISQSLRALAVRNGELFDWYWIGDHGTYERLIKDL